MNLYIVTVTYKQYDFVKLLLRDWLDNVLMLVEILSERKRDWIYTTKELNCIAR